MMTLAQRTAALVENMERDKYLWSLFQVPQIVMLALVSWTLALLSGYGLYTAITTFRQHHDATVLGRTISIFVGGSSSVLGLVVARFVTKIQEMIKDYFKDRRKYAKFIAEANAISSEAQY
jgi:hypothetical protein